jgi:limonene-1,2-epoxide hydrolase
MSADANRALVLEFLAAWSDSDADRLSDSFTTDGIYWNVPAPPNVGQDAIRAFLRSVPGMGISDFRFETTASAVEGDMVFTERVDHFVRNGVEVALPVAGVFKVRDGKIASWSDYFDGSMPADSDSPT